MQLVGMQGSSSEADLTPTHSTDKETGFQPQPQILPRSVSTPGHKVSSRGEKHYSLQLAMASYIYAACRRCGRYLHKPMPEELRGVHNQGI